VSNTAFVSDELEERASYEEAPHLVAIEVEQSFLGALLLTPTLYWKICDRLMPEHFFDGLHASIYREMAAKIVAGQNPSPNTLAVALGPQLQEVGGATYLIRLLSAAPSASAATDHAETIRELSMRRELRQISQEAGDACLDMQAAVKTADIVSSMEAAIHEVINRGGQNRHGMTALDAARQVVEVAEQARETGRQRGISSGLQAFDRANGLAMPGDLIVIGGATSMGKTALAQQIVWNAANAFTADTHGRRETGARVVAFSMEMTGHQYITRHLGQLSGIPTERIEGEVLAPGEIALLNEAVERMGDLPLFIEDARGLTVERMRSICRRRQHTRGLDLVLIDHLHFIAKPDRRTPALEAIEANVAALKNLALELDCPVFLISHLNRGLWARDDKRPQLGDLHGASAIEKDADTVCFVHREEYWLRKVQPDANSPEYLEWADTLHVVQGKAEIINGKRRRGRANQTEFCAFHDQSTRFYDLARQA
jgi:replicative DNA helicase